MTKLKSRKHRHTIVQNPRFSDAKDLGEIAIASSEKTVQVKDIVDRRLLGNRMRLGIDGTGAL